MFDLTGFVLLLQLSASSCSLVEHLPGAPNSTHLKQYTGFLEASPGQQTFYWFVEAAEAPNTAPLLIWMNGGPGASSLGGILSELGPLLLNNGSLPDKDGEWRLLENPYSWHLAANLLVWEQPAGVGYSHCATPASCPHPWNDTTSKESNLNVLIAFLRAHPHLQGRDTFIAGESYAGVFVPLLGEQVLNFKGTADVTPIRLSGIAVGNGCIGIGKSGGACGPDSMDALLQFMQGAGAVEEDEAAEVRAVCGSQLKHGGVGPGVVGFSPVCLQELRKLATILGDYNFYNFASPCGPDGTGNWGDGKAFTCGADTAVPKYLNDENVRKAIGTFGVGPQIWEDWDGDSPNYNITTVDALPSYRALVSAGVRVLVYIGIKDAGGPNFDAAGWTRDIGGKIVARKTWDAGDGHAAGRVTIHERNVTYVTIRGAGHLVPATRPRQALAMVRAWLENREVLEYNGGCQKVWLGKGWADFCGNATEHVTGDDPVTVYV